MVENPFNPYRQWLRISDHELPANYYRLLGLPPFEPDRSRIAQAADGMIAYVRSIPPGEHVSEWQRLIDELAYARQCLIDPELKSRYDVHLRNNPPAATAIPMAAPTSAPTAVPMAQPPTGPTPNSYGRPAAPAYPQNGPGWPQFATPVATPVARPVNAPLSHAPMGNPMAPVARPVTAVPVGAAVRQAEPEFALPGPARRPSLAARRRKRSSAPLVVLLCAGAGVLTLAVVVVLSRQNPLSVASQSPVVTPATPPAAPPAPRPPRVEQAAPPAPRTTPASKPTVEDTPTGGIPVPGLDYGSDAEEISPGSEQPDAQNAGNRMQAQPAAESQPAGVPAKAAGAPNLPPEVQPEPNRVAAPTAEPTAAQAAAFDEALRAAFDALSSRDIASAQQHLMAAEEVAISAEQQQRLRGMQVVQKGVQSFWEAVRDGLEGLVGTTDELELQSGIVRVVEASPDFVILRIAGQNRRFNFESMPPGLAVILAKRWFDPNAASSKVFLGSFLLVDPQGDQDQVRALWDQAARKGVDTDALLPLLKMKP